MLCRVYGAHRVTTQHWSGFKEHAILGHFKNET